MGNPNSGSQADQRLRNIIKRAKDKRCADCKNQYFGRMRDVRRNSMTDTMTFDHLPQYKRAFDIGWVSRVGATSGITPEQLIAEIAKCEVVCWSCHKKRERRRNKEHEQEIQIQTVKKREAAIIAAMCKPFQDIYQAYEENKERKLRKKEFVKRAEMKTAMVNLMEWLVTLGPVVETKPIKVVTNKQAEKNLKDFGLGIILGCRWLDARLKKAKPVLVYHEELEW